MEYMEPVFISEHPIPVMMMKTVGTGKEATCAMLDKRKCSIQEAKPLVCRMYPLNLEPNKELTKLIPCIVSQRKHHYTGTTHLVGDWISENMDEIDETATLWWYKAAAEIGKILKNCTTIEENKEWILTRTVIRLYCMYDTSKDFLSQYAFNLNQLLNEMRNTLN